jgi:hypothetical protein
MNKAMGMSKLKLLVISFFLVTTLGMAGCAMQEPPATGSSPTDKTSEQIDKNKIIKKKDGESDDMERLD